MKTYGAREGKMAAATTRGRGGGPLSGGRGEQLSRARADGRLPLLSSRVGKLNGGRMRVGEPPPREDVWEPDGEPGVGVFCVWGRVKGTGGG